MIECALYISLMRPAISQIGREGPTLLIQTAVEGVHATERIVAVGSSDGDSVPGRLIGRAKIVVIRACHTGHGKGIHLERQGKIGISGLLIESAHL